MARTSAAISVAIGLAPLTLATACGTVDIHVHATYSESGKWESSLTTKGTGAMSAFLLDWDLREQFKQDGWQVTTEASDDATTLTATWTSEEVPLSVAFSGGTDGQSGEDSGAVWREERGWLKTTYELRYRMPAEDLSSALSAEETGLFDEEALAGLMDTMVRLHVSITLPGRIVETNADSVEGNTATWHFTYSGLQRGREVYVRSERSTAPSAGLLSVLGVLCLLGLASLVLVAVILNRRRRSKPSGPLVYTPPSRSDEGAAGP